MSAKINQYEHRHTQQARPPQLEPPQSVKSTTHLFFDEKHNTFRLYAGTSLYAFSISPELSLEHLYFGKTLHSGFDLRYLSQSSRATVFNTSENQTAQHDYEAEYSLLPKGIINNLLNSHAAYGPLLSKRAPNHSALLGAGAGAGAAQEQQGDFPEVCYAETLEEVSFYLIYQ